MHLQEKSRPRGQSTHSLWCHCRRAKMWRTQQARSGNWWNCSVTAQQSSSTKVRLYCGELNLNVTVHISNDNCYLKADWRLEWDQLQWPAYNECSDGKMKPHETLRLFFYSCWKRFEQRHLLVNRVQVSEAPHIVSVTSKSLFHSNVFVDLYYLFEFISSRRLIQTHRTLHIQFMKHVCDLELK